MRYSRARASREDRGERWELPCEEVPFLILFQYAGRWELTDEDEIVPSNGIAAAVWQDGRMCRIATAALPGERYEAGVLDPQVLGTLRAKANEMFAAKAEPPHLPLGSAFEKVVLHSDAHRTECRYFGPARCAEGLQRELHTLLLASPLRNTRSVVWVAYPSNWGVMRPVRNGQW